MFAHQVIFLPCLLVAFDLVISQYVQSSTDVAGAPNGLSAVPCGVPYVLVNGVCVLSKSLSTNSGPPQNCGNTVVVNVFPASGSGSSSQVVVSPPTQGLPCPNPDLPGNHQLYPNQPVASPPTFPAEPPSGQPALPNPSVPNQSQPCPNQPVPPNPDLPAHHQPYPNQPVAPHPTFPAQPPSEQPALPNPSVPNQSQPCPNQPVPPNADLPAHRQPYPNQPSTPQFPQFTTPPIQSYPSNEPSEISTTTASTTTTTTSTTATPTNPTTTTSTRATTTTTAPPITLPPPAPLRQCPKGTVLIKDECHLVYCSSGVYDGDHCVNVRCPEGTNWTGQKCAYPPPVNVANIHFNKTFINHKSENTPDIVLNNVQHLLVNASLSISTNYRDYEEESEEIDEVDAIPTPQQQTKCCTVIAPRTCRCVAGTNRWQCFNPRQKICASICSTPKMALQPGGINSWNDNDVKMLTVPPNWNSGSQVEANYSRTADPYDCSGCALGEMSFCSPYCYNYYCKSPRCTLYDLQQFCDSPQSAGSVGCQPEYGWQQVEGSIESTVDT